MTIYSKIEINGKEEEKANKKAKAQGKNEEKRLITEKSLKIGISIDKIIGATGLSKSEF